MSDLRKYTNIAALVAIAFLAGSLVTGGKGCDWKPTPVVPTYSAKVQVVADAIKSNPTKAHRLATFYAEFSKTAPNLKTVGDFAAAHRAGLVALGASEPPMVGAEIDAALAEVIGLVQDDPIEPKKGALAARLTELSQALAGVK